jgi:hypothetical protein
MAGSLMSVIAPAPTDAGQPVLDVVLHPVAVVLVLVLGVGGAWLGARRALNTTPRFRSEVLLRIDAPLHTPAQASVIATGGDVVLRQMLTDTVRARDLGGAHDLSLTCTPAGADRIRIQAEDVDPAAARRAADLAARTVVAAAAQERTRTPSADGAGGRASAAPVETPHLTWARDQFEAHLGRRRQLAEASARARDRDAMLQGVLNRGADVARERLVLETQVSARVQSALADVTMPWYASPLVIEGAAAAATAIGTGSTLRNIMGGTLFGCGIGLVLIACAGSLRSLVRR